MAEALADIDMQALCNGDKQAWDRFVPLAAAVVRAIAWRVLSASGNEQEVPDVVQEVFVRLSRDRFFLLRSYDAGRASLSTWLGVIASGAAVDWLRRRRKGEMPLDEVPEEQLEAVPARTGGRLKLPADALSPRQALILTLLYEHDLTPDEVASLLRIEAQTVRSQRHKAISRLRALWRDEME